MVHLFIRLPLTEFNYTRVLGPASFAPQMTKYLKHAYWKALEELQTTLATYEDGTCPKPCPVRHSKS